MTQSGSPPPEQPSTTHLVLEALQYVLLALVSVLVAVVVISAFIRIVSQPVPDRDDVPQVSTTLPSAESVEAFGGRDLTG